MFHSSSSSQPAEVFRKDLISAMKLPDSYQLQQEDYWVIQDQWKQEWEKGVQVPVDDTSINDPQFFEVLMKDTGTFKIPDRLIKCYSGSEEQMRLAEERQRQIEATCQYDLDEVDIQWLHIINKEREDMGEVPIDELAMEKIIEQCEVQCQKNIEHAIQTEEGLGIEYDEDICCAVCRAPDSEDGNEMVFCDKCDICVHQACYGVVKIPEGSWMCRCCALGLQPQCMLCGKKGGAMKSTRSGTKWAHVNCALWIPEVSIGDVERMEPITKISQIPPSRWALICNLCRERTGACIQCSVKTCKTAYHVTCGVEHSLEMEQVLDENKDVKFRSFCLKHTNGQKSPADGTVKATPRKKSEEEKANARAVRIQRVTEEFQKYVKLKDVASSLNIKDDMEVVDLVFEYWKLKRKSGFNKPLLNFPREDDKDKNSEEYNLHARMKMFVHLRQDLERVRNLCYMVQRREKLSRQMLRLREGLFKKQCEFFNGNLTRMTSEEVDWAARAGEISARVPFPMSEDVILNKWLSIPSDGPKLMFDDEDDDDETTEDDSDLEMEAKKERDKKKREKAAARKKKEAETAARLKEKLAQVKGPVSSNTRGVKHRRVSSVDGKSVYEDEIRSRKGGTPSSNLSDSSSKSSPGSKNGGDEEESREATPERKERHKQDTPEKDSNESDAVEKKNEKASNRNSNVTKKVKGKTLAKSQNKSEKLKERPVQQNKLDHSDRKKIHKNEKPNSVHNHKLDHKPAKRKSIESKEKDSKHSINNKDRKFFKDPKRKNAFGKKNKSAGTDSISMKNHVLKEDQKVHFLGEGLEVKEEWTYWQTSEQRKVQSEKEVRHDEDKNAAEFLLQEVLGDKTLSPLTPFEEGHAKNRFEDFIERHAEDQNAADFLANEIFDEKISSQDMKDKFAPLSYGNENDLKQQGVMAAERLLSGLGDKIPDWEGDALFGSKSDSLEDLLGNEPIDLGPEGEKLVDKVLALDMFKSQTSISQKTTDDSKQKRKSRPPGQESIRETSKEKLKEHNKLDRKHRPETIVNDHKKKSDSKKPKHKEEKIKSTEILSNHEKRVDSASGSRHVENKSKEVTSKVGKRQQQKKGDVKEVAGKNQNLVHDKKKSRGFQNTVKENGEIPQNSSKMRHSQSRTESNKSSKKRSSRPNRKAENPSPGNEKESLHVLEKDRIKEEGQQERLTSPKSRQVSEERSHKKDDGKTSVVSKETKDIGSSETSKWKEPSRKEKTRAKSVPHRESLSPVSEDNMPNEVHMKKRDKPPMRKSASEDNVKRKRGAKKMHGKLTDEEQPVLPIDKSNHDHFDKSKSAHRSRRKSEDAKSKKLANSKKEDESLTISRSPRNGEETLEGQSQMDENDFKVKASRQKEGGEKTVSLSDEISTSNEGTSIFDVQGIDDALHHEKGMDTNEEAISIFDLDPSEELFKPEERRMSRRASSASSDRGSQADSESTDDPESSLSAKSKRKRRGTSSRPFLADSVNKSASKSITGMNRSSRRRGSLSSDRSSLADSFDESEEKDTRTVSMGKSGNKRVTPSTPRLQSHTSCKTVSQDKKVEDDSNLTKTRRKSEKSFSEHSVDEPEVEACRKSLDRPPTPTFARELPVGRDKGMFSVERVTERGRTLRRDSKFSQRNRRDASEGLPDDSKLGVTEGGLPKLGDGLHLEQKEETTDTQDAADKSSVAKRERTTTKDATLSPKLAKPVQENIALKDLHKETEPLPANVNDSPHDKASDVVQASHKNSTSTRRSRRGSATGHAKVADAKIVSVESDTHETEEISDSVTPSHRQPISRFEHIPEVAMELFNGDIPAIRSCSDVADPVINENMPPVRPVDQNSFQITGKEDAGTAISDEMPPLGPPEPISIDGLWPGQKSSLEKMAEMVSESSTTDLPPPILEPLHPPMAKPEDAFSFNHQFVNEANFTRNYNVAALKMVPDHHAHMQTVVDVPNLQPEEKTDGRRTSGRTQSIVSSNQKMTDKILPTRTLRSSVDSSILHPEVSMKKPPEIGLFGMSGAGVNQAVFPEERIDEKVDLPTVDQIISNHLVAPPKIGAMEQFVDGKVSLPRPPDMLLWDLERSAEIPVSKDFKGISVRRKSAPGQVPDATQEQITLSRTLQRNNSLRVDQTYPSQLNFSVSDMPIFSSLIPKEGSSQSSLWDTTAKDMGGSSGIWKQPSKESSRVLPGNVWEEPPSLLSGKQPLEPFPVREAGKIARENLFRMKTTDTTQPFSRTDPTPPKSDGSWRDILDNMPKDSGFGWNPTDLPEFLPPRAPVIPTFSQFNHVMGDNVGLLQNLKPPEKTDQEDDAPQAQDKLPEKDKEATQPVDKNEPSLSPENGIYFHKKLSCTLTQRRREVRCKAPIGNVDAGSQQTSENSLAGRCDPSQQADSITDVNQSVNSEKVEDTTTVDPSSSPKTEQNSESNLEKGKSDRERFSRRLRDRKKVPDSDSCDTTTTPVAKSKDKEKVDENRNITATEKTETKDANLETKAKVSAGPSLENEDQQKIDTTSKSHDPTNKSKVNSKLVLSPRRKEVSLKGIAKRHLLADEFNKHIRGSPLKHGKDGRKKSSPQGTKKKTATRRSSKRQKTSKDETESKTKGGVFDFTSDEDDDQPAPIKLPKSPRVAAMEGQTTLPSKVSVAPAPPPLEVELEIRKEAPVEEMVNTTHSKDELKEGNSEPLPKEEQPASSRRKSENSNLPEINPIKKRWLSGSKTSIESMQEREEQVKPSSFKCDLITGEKPQSSSSKATDINKKMNQIPNSLERSESDQGEGGRRRSMRVKTKEKEAAAAKAEEEVKDRGPLNERRASLRNRRKDVTDLDKGDDEEEDTSLLLLKKKMEESCSSHDEGRSVTEAAEMSVDKPLKPVVSEKGNDRITDETVGCGISEISSKKENKESGVGVEAKSSHHDIVTVEKDNENLIVKDSVGPADSPAAPVTASGSTDDAERSSHSDLRIEGADGRLVIKNWGKFSLKKKKKKKKKKSPLKDGYSSSSHISNILESSTLCVKESSDGPKNGLRLKITTIDRYFKPLAKKAETVTETPVREETVQTPIKLFISKSRLSPSFKSNISKRISTEDATTKTEKPEEPLDTPREKLRKRVNQIDGDGEKVDVNIITEVSKINADLKKEEKNLHGDIVKDRQKPDMDVPKQNKKSEMDVFEFDTAIEDDGGVNFNTPTVGSKTKISRELNHSTSSAVVSSPFDCPSPNEPPMTAKRELRHARSEESDNSTDGEKRQPHRKRRRKAKEQKMATDAKGEAGISNSLQLVSSVVT